MIAIITIIIPFIISIFRNDMGLTFIAYVISLLLMILLLALYQVKRHRKYPLLFAYSFCFVVYLLVIYLNIFRFYDRPAASIIIFFVVIPLIFVDKSVRINTAMILTFIIHVVLSYIFKGSHLGSVDILNTTIAVVFGMLFGRIFLISRLKTFEIEKQLITEKETDFLTKLYNRRKLYNDLINMDNLEVNQLGVILFDLDHFKEYNDKYGHLNGDISLEILGKGLLKMQEQFPIKFYRFGGEEFVGIMKNLEKPEVMMLSEQIRATIKKLDLPSERLSVSMGVSMIEYKSNQSIDYYLEKADKALYKAKESGRDRIEIAL